MSKKYSKSIAKDVGFSLDRTERGITLIALVITIIVLLILAAVSLRLVAGSDGLLNRASKAVDATEIATAKEQVELFLVTTISEYYQEKYIDSHDVGSKLDFIQTKVTDDGMQLTRDYFLKLSSVSTSKIVNSTKVASLENAYAIIEGATELKIEIFKGTSSDDLKIIDGIINSDGKVEWNEEVTQNQTPTPTPTPTPDPEPEPETYTITYNSNGGIGTMQDTEGTSPEVAANTFTVPSGYVRFKEWNTASDGTGTTVAAGTTVSTNTDLYAIWEGVRAGETATGENKKYGTTTAIIPDGWTVSGITGETSINSGLVIYDLRDASGNAVDTSSWDSNYWNTNTETIRQTYNQFVWVPVNDNSKFTRNDWKNWNGTDEPSAYTATTLTASACSESASTDPTGKYAEMYSSVTTNHGFYIARYEAGTTATSGTGIRGTVVSKRNAKVYNYIGWNGTSSSDNATTQMTTTTGGAVEVATGMDTPNVNSTLCYGVQWDAVMRWISEDSSLKQYITNSTGKGNYSDTNSTYGSPGNTGIFEMKNIYDMAGNVWEWTMEAYNTYDRVRRGGVYGDSGSYCPVSSRSGNSPIGTTASSGFVSLCICNAEC